MFSEKHINENLKQRNYHTRAKKRIKHKICNMIFKGVKKTMKCSSNKTMKTQSCKNPTPRISRNNPNMLLHNHYLRSLLLQSQLDVSLFHCPFRVRIANYSMLFGIIAFGYVCFYTLKFFKFLPFSWSCFNSTKVGCSITKNQIVEFDGHDK